MIDFIKRQKQFCKNFPFHRRAHFTGDNRHIVFPEVSMQSCITLQKRDRPTTDENVSNITKKVELPYNQPFRKFL